MNPARRLGKQEAGNRGRGAGDRWRSTWVLLAVDGTHQADLDWYVHAHPDSALAHLVGNGASSSRAQTPVPSDSLPGLVGQVAGGNSSSTGVYYDDTWNAAERSVNLCQPQLSSAYSFVRQLT